MSAREWKPGDVAMVEGKVAFRVDGSYNTREPFWQWGHGGFTTHPLGPIHPLARIDPESREVERLVDLFVKREGARCGRLLSPWVVAMLTEDFRDALREFANPTPPIEEPTTWGVVKAACVHSDERRTWMRHEDGNWYVVGTDTKNNPDDWDSLVDPEVVREGVTQ